MKKEAKKELAEAQGVLQTQLSAQWSQQLELERQNSAALLQQMQEQLATERAQAVAAALAIATAVAATPPPAAPAASEQYVTPPAAPAPAPAPAPPLEPEPEKEKEASTPTASLDPPATPSSDAPGGWSLLRAISSPFSAIKGRLDPEYKEINADEMSMYYDEKLKRWVDVSSASTNHEAVCFWNLSLTAGVVRSG